MQRPHTRTRFGVLLALLATLGLENPAAQAPRSRDLTTATIADIQAAVDTGTLTYESLVRMYLRRIEAYDKNGPKLNAVLQVHPREHRETEAQQQRGHCPATPSTLAAPHSTSSNLKPLQAERCGSGCGPAAAAGSHRQPSTLARSTTPFAHCRKR